MAAGAKGQAMGYVSAGGVSCAEPGAAPSSGILDGIRGIAIRSLGRMYRPEAGLFMFRLRRDRNGIVPEGISRRYTAIALIGLSGEEDPVVSSVLGGEGLRNVCGRLADGISRADNLGDTALAFWASCAVGYPDRRELRGRLVRLESAKRVHPVVETAWALAALCTDPESSSGELREKLARRLIASFNARSGVFPHQIGENGAGARSHVSCFADMVYPIHALSLYHGLSGDRAALDAAGKCAMRICGEQGPAGQWWWHYDLRTGKVVEPYPVYAIHQDAMAPMALFALREAGGADFGAHVSRGLSWLASSPELKGGSLIDCGADIIWRKVARREPGKLSRYAQALASRIHPSLRVPGLDKMFLP
ncbi:MAG: hypothetical protein ACXWWT_09600, partial [Candidatus Deferrimicrobiaceae bacterium]